jgi:hypothetical protein
MTTTQVKARRGSKLIVMFLLLVIVGLGLWLGVVGGGTAVSAPKLSNSVPLSAATALSNGQPTLFIFTPMEKCSIQYCLTADSISVQLDDLSALINVVGVPVQALAVHSSETPPSFLFVHWDLYPISTIAEWIPKSELTPYGWGLPNTQLVLVGADGQLIADLGSELNVNRLHEALTELPDTN